jgi:hypothetical protein
LTRGSSTPLYCGVPGPDQTIAAPGGAPTQPEAGEASPPVEDGRANSLVKTNRDLRIDFFRGLSLWWIFTDHVPADVLGALSIRNFAVCDATEVFVLLAGYAAGIAYGGTMRDRGWLFAGADVVRRAWTLYIAHIFLFVIFAAQVGISATALDRADFLDEIHLNVLGEAPYRALFEALTLHFQPAYLNILPRWRCRCSVGRASSPPFRSPCIRLRACSR